MPNSTLQEIVEYRGVEGLVAAEVLTDDNQEGTSHGYTTGEVFAIAGVAEISKTTDSSNEAHYYDNIPAVVVSNTSSDEITISASAIPLDVLAEITGQKYDQTTGALIEGPRDVKYFALGYITKKTNGDLMYVWRFKGTFNIPDQTNATEDDGTDANGQEIVFTGISTTHKFTKNVDSNGNKRGAKALVVDLGKGLADVSTFFDEVTTPDSLQAKASPTETYTLTTIYQDGGTLTIKNSNDETLTNGASITAGEVLTITGTGTILVNGEAFTSGNTYTVTGNTTVSATGTGA